MARPSKLNHVLELSKDGTPITVRDRIIEWLRIGMPRDTSCFRAGITTSTMHHWLKEAARLEEMLHLHPTRYDALTDHERDLLTFSQDVDVAVAEGESRYFMLLAGIARGGAPITKTTRKYDRTGMLVEEVITEETAMASERALMWILERRYPANYPRGTQQLEVAITGRVADPLTEQERAKHLFEAIEAKLAPALDVPRETTYPQDDEPDGDVSEPSSTD